MHLIIFLSLLLATDATWYNHRSKRQATRVIVQSDGKTTARNTLRIGHIGAIGALPKYEKILELSQKELWNAGVLGEDFDVEIISRDGCGESFEGVAAAADMYHVDNVTAFLGPYCNAEMIPVATMATFWNLPIVAYMATSNALSDKSIYRTLVRVSIRTVNSNAEATAAFIRHNKWRKVAFVSNAGSSAFERIVAFEQVFKRTGVDVVSKIIFDETATAEDMARSGQIDEIRTTARVIIVMFSSTRDLTAQFRRATQIAGLSEAEYVFVFPWIQEGANGASPFVGASSDMLSNVFKTYSNCIMIDDVNGFDDRLVRPFFERMATIGLNEKDIDLTNIYGYLALYDSLQVIGHAGRRILNSTGNFEMVRNGTMVWNTLRRMTLPGMVSNAGVGSGTVMLDDLAERVPYFNAFYISEKRQRVMPVANITPSLIGKCDGLKTKTGCSQLNVTDLLRGYWESTDGQLPRDEPACGFRNERCDYTMIVVSSSVVSLAVFMVTIVLLMRRRLETKALDKQPWRIFRDDVRIVDEEQVKSMLSIGSSNTKISNLNQCLTKNHAIIGVNTHAVYRQFAQRKAIQFNRADLALLMRMKQAVHDNINPFLGIAFNEKEEMLVLWKFCSRGSLQDLIYNDNFQLDEKFHGAFVKDITVGLDYLHCSMIGYHGSLTTWAALIDRNWTVKLSDYGIFDPLKRWEKHGSIMTESISEGEEDARQYQHTAILYVPPEARLANTKNSNRRMEQKWQEDSVELRRAADIYALGIVIYEILFRQLPFAEKTSLEDLVAKAKAGEKITRPGMQHGRNAHPDLVALLQDCWHDSPEARPTIRRVRMNSDHYLRVRGSLVDQMMRMMEEYANNLEKIVQERTDMFEAATEKANRLLAQLLPKYVANELKFGRTVAPKTFLQATVMFSDIVGFTTLCSSFNPLEVVNLLNSVYSGFDAIITKNDCYKVETIGDAYMIVSGVPEENGRKHIGHIADTALDIMQYLSAFRVPNKRNEKLRIRLGVHSGPVAAGVVGQNAPRYCLFGDTVTIAHFMESSGEPERIQLSGDANTLIHSAFPEFHTTLRGEVEIKGFDKINTFWLLDKN